MKKKAVSLLMVAAMMTTMAAGCGNKAANNAGSDAAADNSTTSDAAAEETAGTEAAAVETAGTEAAAADSEDEPWSGTITVWSPQEDQDTGWLAKECDAFNAAHPNWDITFNYGVCAEGDAKVCRLGEGPVISFMDRGAIYDKELYRLAFSICEKNKIPCQTKSRIAGGNDSGAIHVSRGGVRTLAISLPCRYLHSPSCLADLKDLDACTALLPLLIKSIMEEVSSI